MTQGGNRTKNCTEVRMMFQAGPAVYRKDIATKDINSLKVLRLTLQKILLILRHKNCVDFFFLCCSARAANEVNHAKWLAKVRLNTRDQLVYRLLKSFTIVWKREQFKRKQMAKTNDEYQRGDWALVDLTIFCCKSTRMTPPFRN